MNGFEKKKRKFRRFRNMFIFFFVRNIAVITPLGGCPRQVTVEQRFFNNTAIAACSITGVHNIIITIQNDRN